MTRIKCDLLIAGASAGGVAAALAAAKAGAVVCMLEASCWPGGQLTAQGVCTPDENAWIEGMGCTASYAEFRRSARNWYRERFRLAPHAAENSEFNAGNCWVSRLAYEPKTGVQLLQFMMAPLQQQGALRVWYNTTVTSCQVEADCIVRVAAQTSDKEPLEFIPLLVLDATDTGELLALCGREGEDWITGAESHAQTGEPDAPPEPKPHWVQPFTFPFALEWSPETASQNKIAPPADYSELRQLQGYHILHGAITGVFEGNMPWWRYRRILAAENFEDERILHDTAMINTQGNDYYGGNIIGADAGGAAEQAETLARARRASLGYAYWLQNECKREKPAPDGAEYGYPEFRLRTDLFDTGDGCSAAPYIRESRRIVPMRRILEQEIVVCDFSGNVCRGDNTRASLMPDTVGIGHYALDIHPNRHGEPNHYVPTRPFQIPMGALIPVRLANLLPACKNLGTTHLTNGAYRLHPIEWNIGESAGLLAAWCAARNTLPAAVYRSAEQTREFQKSLIARGIPLYWYTDVLREDAAFAAVQNLAMRQVTTPDESSLLFHPELQVSPQQKGAWCRAAGIAEDGLPRKRAELAQALLQRMPAAG